ncbi:MAG: nickel pincer cofactor biosynthesis protein LarB [archaeon]|nr:nickel pincer cofactor biosynthesis protein LarB [archaeon]
MADLRDIIKDVKEGKLDEEALMKLLKIDYVEKIGNMANLDVFRKERTGIPEVIFAQPKSAHELIEITKSYLKKKDFVLISRIKDEQFTELEQFIGNNTDLIAEFNKNGRIAKIEKKNAVKSIGIKGKIGIITAGTSDIPVAEEARMVAEAMGCEVISSFDVGIAGFHRIFSPLKKMIQSDVSAIVVAAGMEGTLPGVVSSLVDIPVIGVPTSTGYGIGGKGTGALTTMLQSCSPGLTVVNIDNGFGAGASAALIAVNANKKK